MAPQSKIDLVKVNTLEAKYPQFSDVEIGTMLDAYEESVSYVSYKIALLKSNNPAVSIGPISLENDSKFWQGIANLYLAEYQQEKREASESYGGTIYMKRADETW